MRRKGAALLAFTAFCLTGCTDSTVGIINGTITVDGVPASTGSISFAPVDGKTAPAGAMIENGEYTATVPVGTSKVEVRVPVAVGETKIYDTDDSPIQEILVESLPAKYNDETELTYEVVPGRSEKNFDFAGRKLKKSKKK